MKTPITLILVFLHSLIFAQEPRDHFSQEFFEHQRFAHRGGYANGPENTLKTILDNLENGVCGIEIDVFLTKDQQLVLFHDDTTGRILQDDQNQFISDLTLAELKAIPLRDVSQGTQFVCSLKDLVDTLVILIPEKPELDFILEIDFKPNGESTEAGINALLEILNDHLPTFGDRLYNYFFMSTFYPGVLKALEEADPKMKKGFAVNNSSNEHKFKARMAIIFAPLLIKKFSAEVYEPNMCMITPRRVRKWHKRGKLINAWTANTTCQKAEMEKYPIAYTTNCPDGTCDVDDSDQVGKAKKWCKKCEED